MSGRPRPSIAISAAVLALGISAHLAGAVARAEDGTWSRHESVPLGRMGHATAYDSDSHRIYVFGGYHGSSRYGVGYQALLNDLWVLHLQGPHSSPMGISKVETVGDVPGVRMRASLIYDSARRRLVLFGGGTNDVWSCRSKVRRNGRS